MDKYVQQSIDARKQAFLDTYEIEDESLKVKINTLFKKIEELGNTSLDSLDFEKKFASSSLNKEYTDLFTEIATKSKIKENVNCSFEEEKNNNNTLDEIASETKYIVKEATLPARRRAREAFDSKLRDTPLGKIEQIGNTANVFRRFFKK